MNLSSRARRSAQLSSGLAIALLAVGLPGRAWSQMSNSAPAAASLAPAPSLSSADKAFVVAVAEGSTNEIALSQLAADHSSRDDVKAFAQMMITDHSRLNAMLTDLAALKGVGVDQAVMKGRSDHVAGLAKKNGAAFDAAYIKAMVKSHADTEAAFRHEADKGQDVDVVAFAGQNLPTISEHLAHAKMLAAAKP
jgi:putative membrane protein